MSSKANGAPQSAVAFGLLECNQTADSNATDRFLPTARDFDGVAARSLDLECNHGPEGSVAGAQLPAKVEPAPAPQPEMWLTLSEAGELEGISRQAMEKRLAKSPRQFTTKGAGRRTRNGKRQTLVALSSLSKSAQTFYHLRHVAEAEGELDAVLAGCEVRPARAAVVLVGGVPVLAGDPLCRPDVSTMNTYGRQDVVEKYRRNLRAAREAMQAALVDATKRVKVKVARRYGMSPETLYRYLRAVKAGRYYELCPANGGNRGKRTSCSPELRAAIEGLYAGPVTGKQQPSPQQAYEYALEVCETADPPIAPPSKSTVWRICRALTKAEAVAGRKGKAAVANEISFRGWRDPEAVIEQHGMNAMWFGDCRQQDTAVRIPSGEVVRPWLIMWLDAGSARIVGYALRLTPTCDGVHSAFRMGAIGRTEVALTRSGYTTAVFPGCGLPQVIYIDNGSEFKGVLGEVGLRALELVNLRPCHAGPRRPWSKGPIEAAFSSFKTRVENLIYGWVGANPDERPDISEQQRKEAFVLTFDEYAATLAAFIMEWNHARPIGKMRTKPPMGYYEGFEPEPVPAALLDILLKRSAKRVVAKDGIEIADLKDAKGRKIKYWCFDDPGWQTLVGEEVDLFYCIEEPHHVFARLTRTGQRFELTPVEPMGWGMAFGGEPDDAFKAAQRTRGQQMIAITDRMREHGNNLDPAAADRTGTLALMAAVQRGELPEADRWSFRNAELRAGLAREKALDGHDIDDVVNAKAIALAADMQSNEAEQQASEKRTAPAKQPLADSLQRSAAAWFAEYGDREGPEDTD